MYLLSLDIYCITRKYSFYIEFIGIINNKISCNFNIITMSFISIGFKVNDY
jgi:hypothetical protein